MTLEMFIAENAVFTRKRNTGEEWEIQQKKGKVKIKHAAYLSIDKYNQLKEKYSGYLDSLDIYDAEDFIEEARQESFAEPGGYVVFFRRKKENYVLTHTKPVKQIKTLK